MIEKNLTLVNPEGMHARPAGIFVKTASQFSSAIEVQYNGVVKNGKSVLNLMSLGMKFQDHFIIKANGADEAKAIETLSSLVENQFKV